MNPIFYLFIIPFFELLCLIISWYSFNKYSLTNERFFPYFLTYVFFNELLGILLSFILGVDNNWIYNIYFFISFNFYFYWYYKIINSRILKNIILLFSVSFSLVALYFFVSLKWDYYHEFTFIFGAILTIFVTTFHFYELLNNNKVIVVNNNLSFWISTGLLMFNLGMVPLMFFSKIFNASNEVRILILISLNFFLYACYSIGFILCKPTKD